jgi:ubiquinone/menaquinone biosynthesis C-methylase UbiE
MSDPIKRFSTRVENYVKYRPGYPREIIDLLTAECGLTSDSIVADMGSGTGILSELLLRHGNKVYGVEPNPEMRAAAERLLKDYTNFVSVDGRAEATTLADLSVDLVTAGQAFHWFDQPSSRQEFLRILKTDGWVVLTWNERRLNSTPFLGEYEEFLIRFGTDYQRVRHENVQKDMNSFFAPGGFKLAVFENLQELDLQGLTGRLLSNSYAPEPGNPEHLAMLNELKKIFLTHQKGDKVTIDYDTKVFYGHLRSPPGQ